MKDSLLSEDFAADWDDLMPRRAEQTRLHSVRARRDMGKAPRKSTASKAAAAALEAAKAAAAEQARMEAEALKRAQAEAAQRALIEAENRAAAEAEARAKAEAEAEARAKIEAEKRAAAVAEARAKIEAEQRAAADAARRAQEQAEARARIEAEQRAAAEAAARAKAAAEARAKAEAQQRADEEAARRAEAEAAARAKAEAEARAKIEAEQRAAEAAKRRAEAAAQAKQQAERTAKLLAKQRAEAAAVLRAAEDAKQRAREKAARRALADAEMTAAESSSRVEVKMPLGKGRLPGTKNNKPAETAAAKTLKVVPSRPTAKAPRPVPVVEKAPEPLVLEQTQRAPAPAPQTAPEAPQKDLHWSDLPLAVSGSRRALTAAMPVVDASRDSASVRAFDLLRTKLRQVARENGWRHIGIAAPTAGCGTTFTAVNLALSLSRIDDTRTLLMDMNLRAPGVAQAFDIDAPGAMTSCLVGEVAIEDHLIRASDTLALGLSGTPDNDAAEVLQSDYTRNKIDEICTDLAPDVVLYDLPAMLPHDDVSAFLPQLDCILLISDGTQTMGRQLAECEKMLDGKVPLLGVLLNKARNSSIPTA